MTHKWDYRNSKIKPIPNFDDSINEFFEDDEYQLYKDNYTCETNWFNSLQNKINHVSKSDNFKLTVAKLNKLKLDENKDNNNSVTYTAETVAIINQTAADTITPNIFVRIWRSLVSWVTSLF